MSIITFDTPSSITLEVTPPSAIYGPLVLDIQDMSIALSADYTSISLSIPGTSPISLTIPSTQGLSLQLDVGQGPSGVIGSAYAVRIDEVSSTVIYRGEAVAGSTDGSTVWRIQKIVISGSSTSVTWASGNANFDKIWTNRLTYTYS